RRRPRSDGTRDRAGMESIGIPGRNGVPPRSLLRFTPKKCWIDMTHGGEVECSVHGEMPKLRLIPIGRSGSPGDTGLQMDDKSREVCAAGEVGRIWHHRHSPDTTPTERIDGHPREAGLQAKRVRRLIPMSGKSGSGSCLKMLPDIALMNRIGAMTVRAF